MPKTKISEFSATPGNNTDIDGINIGEGCAPSGINDAIRELMAQLKDFQAGTAGDSFNGPIGSTTPAAGAFTNLSASGTFALTGDQVQISEGGTGQTTANAAFNALAPSQTSNSGKYLKTDGTNTSWDAIDINTADITGTLPIANGGTGLTALGTGVQTALGQNVTGSGGIVLATSPTLVTPALGTPSSVTLTNATGLPLSTGVTGTLATTNGGTGLTSFTANGVVYASSSSALTTGSALTFDGTNLGVGTSSPTSYGASYSVLEVAGSTSGVINVKSGSTLYGQISNSPNEFKIDAVGASSSLVFLRNTTEGMRLTSTGLGIGTSSPSYKLDVQGAIGEVFVKSTTGTNYAALNVNNTGGNFYAGINNSAGTAFSTTAYSAILWHTGNYPMVFATNNTERMRLDSSGTLRLVSGLQGNQLQFWDTSGVAERARMGINASNGLDFAVGSTTPRMTITSGGNLLVGTTSNSRAARLRVEGIETAYFTGYGNGYGIGLWMTPNPSATGGTATPISFQNVSDATVGSISTTASATTYNTSSDYRLKNITGPITTSGAYIDSLNPVEGTWKADGSTFVGLIAHEVQEASRTNVATGVKDGEEMQGMDYSSAEIIANIIAELQSLRARVAQLEAK